MGCRAGDDRTLRQGRTHSLLRPSFDKISAGLPSRSPCWASVGVIPLGVIPLWHSYAAVGAVAVAFAVIMVRRSTPTDVLFLGALMLLTILGVVTPEQAFSGFSNQAVLTIAGLFAVTAALRRVGLLDWIGRKLLGSATNERSALAKLSAALVSSSAFILNTALVAMLMPVIIDWCRRRQVSPSRMLIPLSYLTILGGTCTLIGTSTTLVAQGKLREMQASYESHNDGSDKSAAFIAALHPMALFEIGAVGLPCALAGAGFLLLIGHRLLPDRQDMIEQLGDQRREYLVEMLVRDDCELIGKSIEEAGLRHLPGLFLIEIDRAGETITPVAPHDVLHASDRLVFAGVVSTIIDLEKIPGLIPAADMSYEFHPQQRQQRQLTEVVLSRTSPLIGRTVRDANFRQRYNAAVVAVHRNGVRLTNKIGDIRFDEGDTLLLQTRSSFVQTYRNSRDFYLVSSVDGSNAMRHHKLPLAAALAGGLLLWLVVAAWFGAGQGWSSTAVAALTIAALMVVTRCVPLSEARTALDLHTLVTIAAALGLGKALEVSGAASGIAETLVSAVGDNPWLLLVVVYVLAMILTEAITNNAVAAMLLPLAAAVAWQAGYSPRPYVMAVALAASLSFITPIGYQTNLMVMGPGGYRPSDYLKVGVPMALVVMTVALLLIPRLWPY